MKIIKIFFTSRNLFFIAILVLWEVLVRLSIIDAAIVAPPSGIFVRSLSLIYNGTLQKHLLVSVLRISAGFSIATFMGIAVALLLYQFDFLYYPVKSLIEIIRSISPIALFPLFILFFGLGFTSKVAIIVWVAWIPIFINTYQGLRNIPQLYFKVGKTFGLSKIDLLLRVALPATGSYTFAGMKTALGFSWMVIVAAEMIGSNSGLGYMALVASSTFKVADLFVAITTISFIGFLMTQMLASLEKNIYHRW